MQQHLMPRAPRVSAVQAKTGIDDPAEAMRAALRALAHEPHICEALVSVYDGMPVYDAAKEHDCNRDHLTRLSLRHGLITQTGRIVSNHRRLAAMATEELERRLIESPQAMSTLELNVVGGTATDKIAKHEAWGQRQESTNPYASGLAQALEAIKDSGGSITLELRVERAERETVEIESVREGPVQEQ